MLLERIAITPGMRKRLIALSVLAFVISAWIVTDTTHAQVELSRPTNVTVHVASPNPSIFKMAIVDPFVTVQGTASSTIGNLGGNMQVPQLGALNVPSTMADAPGSAISGQQATTYTLQGVMDGAPALAEFQSTTDPNDTQVLQVGDKLGDRRIVQIAKGFVRFDNGSTIDISDGESLIPNAPPINSGALVPNIPTPQPQR